MSGISALTALTSPDPVTGITGPAGINAPGLNSLPSLPDSDTLTLSGNQASGAVNALLNPTGTATPVAGSTPAAPTNAAGNTFADVLDQVSGSEKNAQKLGAQLATGQLSNVHEFTAAAAQARLSVQTVTAVRNRALDAFSEVMRMQV